MLCVELGSLQTKCKIGTLSTPLIGRFLRSFTVVFMITALLSFLSAASMSHTGQTEIEARKKGKTKTIYIQTLL